MAPPSFLNTAFAFQTVTGVTDVTTVRDAVITMITSTLPTTATNVFPNGQRWTIVSGTRYKSPVDAAGRYMEVDFTRLSAGAMNWTVADPTGSITTTKMDLSGTTSAEISAGPGHLMVALLNAGTWEVGRAFIADPTPEPLGSTNVYVYATSYRQTGGSLVTNGNNWTFWGFRYLGGTTTGLSGAAVEASGVPLMPAQDTTGTQLRTQAGSSIAVPQFVSIPLSAGNDSLRNGGRLYQVITVDSSFTAGQDITVPIDTGSTGVFRVPRTAVPGGARQYAVRKG